VGREDGKLLAIRQIVQAGLRPPVLLFMQSIDRAKVGVMVCDSQCASIADSFAVTVAGTLFVVRVLSSSG
jgi:hypothetical protein